MIFSAPARCKIAFLLGTALLMAGCSSAPPNRNVPVRMMGSQPALYPSVQRNLYGASPVASPSRDNRTVSVSPYARSGNNTAQHAQNRPVYQRSTVTQQRAAPLAGSLEQQYQQKLAQQKQQQQPVAQKTAAAMPPPVLTKPLNNMSISDVIDSTIKNAPDQPVVETASKPAEKKTETAAVQKPSTLPHQPSKQDIAKLGGDKPQFYWPVRGNVVSTYGDKGNGRKNDGMNITAPKGTAVRAAAEGLVVYSGQDLGGLGNLILIRHSGGFHTAYAHVDHVMVQTGDRVKANDSIASIGKSGNVTTPQLHFEIRDGKKPVNPDNYLPRS